MSTNTFSGIHTLTLYKVIFQMTSESSAENAFNGYNGHEDIWVDLRTELHEMDLKKY